MCVYPQGWMDGVFGQIRLRTHTFCNHRGCSCWEYLMVQALIPRGPNGWCQGSARLQATIKGIQHGDNHSPAGQPEPPGPRRKKGDPQEWLLYSPECMETRKTLTPVTRKRPVAVWGLGAQFGAADGFVEAAYGESISLCNTKKQFITRNHLSQVVFVVDVADSRVGEVNEVVPARLFQQRDILQVHLNALKYLGQVSVVLLRNTSSSKHQLLLL